MIAWLAVFAVTAINDIAWARYIATAASGRRWAASAWASALYLGGAFVVVSYTGNHWLIVPAAIGSFVGTAIGVKK